MKQLESSSEPSLGLTRHIGIAERLPWHTNSTNFHFSPSTLPPNHESSECKKCKVTVACPLPSGPIE